MLSATASLLAVRSGAAGAAALSRHLCVVGLGHDRRGRPPRQQRRGASRAGSSSGSGRQQPRRRPDNAAIAEDAAAARTELEASDLLAARTEDSLARLSGLVSSATRPQLDAELGAAERRHRRAVAMRVQAGKYMPALAAGEASVLLYCAERQAALLHRSDPEVWHPAALAEAFPLTEAAARRLLADFTELHWRCDIQRRDSAVRRLWPSLLRPAAAERAGLGWLRSQGKLALLGFAAGNPELAHYHSSSCDSPADGSDADGGDQRRLRLKPPGQMERLVADYYARRADSVGEMGFLAQAEAAEASAAAEADTSRHELSQLLAELQRLEAVGSDGDRRAGAPYRFASRLEGVLDFSTRFLYDK